MINAITIKTIQMLTSFTLSGILITTASANDIVIQTNKLLSNAKANCSHQINAVTRHDKHSKKELWSICTPNQSTRIIKITSHKADVLFKEVYFEKNNQLIYASETQNYIPINHFVIQPWQVHFYINNGKIIHMPSLGHGKTELDEWNPNDIFTMYQNRLNTLKGIKKFM